MKLFDPDDQRERLLACYGLESDLNAQINEIQAKHALSGWGNSMLTNGIICLLVGFDEEGYTVLEKSRRFFKLAIETNEIPNLYGQYGTESLRLDAYAQCQWLLDAIDDRPSLKKAVENRLKFNALNRATKTDINLTLPMFLESDENEACIALFESTPGLEPPKDIRRVSGEGKMAYIISRYRLGIGEYGWDQIEPGVHHFLKRQVPKWLSNGWYSDCARWMKILFWQSDPTQITPKDALLKCYDYLPTKVRDRGLALARGEG